MTSEAQQSDCNGKDRLTQTQAKAIARRTKGSTVHAYRCPHCGDWHVGRSNRFKQRTTRGAR